MPLEVFHFISLAAFLFYSRSCSCSGASSTAFQRSSHRSPAAVFHVNREDVSLRESGCPTEAGRGVYGQAVIADAGDRMKNCKGLDLSIGGFYPYLHD